MYIPYKNNSALYFEKPISENITYGYYLPGKEYPAEISFTAAWNTYKGYYFFLETPIEPSNNTVLDAFESFLNAEPALQTPTHTGALWIKNSNDKTTVQTIIQTVENEGLITISGNTCLGFGTYRLPIRDKSTIIFNTNTNSLCIGYPAIVGAQPAAADKDMIIPISGAQSGIVLGEVLISDFSDNYETGWKVGFRYNTISNSQFYPLFITEPGRYIVFKMSWDPLNPLNSERTKLQYTGISFKIELVNQGLFQIAEQKNPNLIPSYWRTIYGKPIFLKPILEDNTTYLVFQKYINLKGEIVYYLSPKGEFELCVEDKNTNKFRMLTGLAGTECIQFTAGNDNVTGDRIIFYSDNAAYTKNYPVVQAAFGNAVSLQATVSQTLLDDTCTTSWAVIQPAEGNPDVIYYAAPESAAMYLPSLSEGVLDSCYVQTAYITNESIQNENLRFPMVPYSGLLSMQEDGFSPTDIKSFEIQIIGAVRNQLISTLPLQVIKETEGETIITTTPQGLLATIAGLGWKEVLLAQNTDNKPNFSFINLPNILRNAFQSNELFLVASDNANLGTFQNAIVIEGWQFNVNVPLRKPEQDQEMNNILLLKFRNGAILDLIQNVNSWTDPVNFNYDNDQVTSTQTWLIEYCNEAIALSSKNEQFSRFASLIQDPNWYGILSLKTDINLGNFPKDLKGLLGAMDLSKFNAHHAGVQINYIESVKNTDTGQTGINVKKSNLFGLVSYIDPSYMRSQAGPEAFSLTDPEDVSMNEIAYTYKVLTLQISFANSAITNFESKLQLTSREWFDEEATLNIPLPASIRDQEEKQPTNYSMLFNGHYENHDGHKTYTFLTQKGQYYQYFITSRVLNYLEFVKAQFETVSAIKDPSNPDYEQVTSKFTFYGYLNFKDQEGFDLFSYGSEKGEELSKNKGLYFSGMALDVMFRMDTINNKTSDLTINFNPKQVAFDQSLSSTRIKGIARAFPLSASAILVGNDENTPQKTGYLHVTPPETFISGTLGKKWYGLDQQLHWGGPGALADQAGFIPNFMIAWSPGGAALSTEILIRLPGSAGGSSMLSIQNVLKLKVGTFRIATAIHGENKMSYNLILNNIALSLMALKFPPVGNTNLMLLGDPEEPGTMGWYGAYINK